MKEIVHTGKGCLIIIAVSTAFTYLCGLFWSVVWKTQNPHDPEFAEKFASMMEILLYLLAVFIAIFFFVVIRNHIINMSEMRAREEAEEMKSTRP